MAESTARIVSYEPSRVEVDVDAAGDGILVLSEVFYPGWKAYVDGEPTEILRANHALRAVEVERGPQAVELVYDPLSFKLGVLFSMVTVLSLVSSSAWAAVRRNTG